MISLLLYIDIVLDKNIRLFIFDGLFLIFLGYCSYLAKSMF
ncbi:protein of unknown function [Cardinium endosymbiont cEper1 of Encarsia pergandiella]|nr:protein of unknown function [Cardinium endosymbiont cEper1 of Encarsia pergandiella]